MSALKITFSNKNNEQLSAQLALPADGRPKAYAIFAHCFTCTKNLNAVRHISRALTQAGIAVLRFDFTGLGESEGEFAETTFSSNIDDLISAADFLQKEYEPAKLLIGHSLGGAAALLACLKISSVEAVVTIGAPADPAHVQKLLAEDLREIKVKGEVSVRISGRSFTIKKQFLDDLGEAHEKHSFEKISKPLLILHSPADEIVNIDNAADIYQQASHPKSFISLDNADHLLTKKEDALYAGSIIASWVSRYVETSARNLLVSDKQVVTRTGETFTTEIMAGQHAIIADEPESVGGNDLGLDPYELLAASLGACTGITIRMYANRKGWPLHEVRVHLQHEKIHAEDCSHCESTQGKIDRIERIIELEGPLDDAQKKRLIEIANKCPVHKTLSTRTEIITSLRNNKDKTEGS